MHNLGYLYSALGFLAIAGGCWIYTHALKILVSMIWNIAVSIIQDRRDQRARAPQTQVTLTPPPRIGNA